jgi:hypothetical protein
MLRLDPKQGVDAAALLQNMGHFLIHEMGFAPNALPNVTLLNEPLAAEDLWKLLYAADICLAPKPFEGFARTIADNLNKPIWTLERLQERQAA